MGNFPPSFSVPCPPPARFREFFVYILLCEDGSFYVGFSNDVERRLRQHRQGKTAKHTSEHAVLRLIYYEGPFDRGTAMGRERQLKRWSRAKKIALVVGNKAMLRQLSRSRETE